MRFTVRVLIFRLMLVGILERFLFFVFFFFVFVLRIEKIEKKMKIKKKHIFYGR